MFSREQYGAVDERAGLLQRRRGRLRLTGNDRRTYLQGLLTNDIAALAPGQGCYAALLTPQGRMISDMRVSELGGSVLVDLPAATSDTVRQRFSDFIFSEDVEVVELRDALVHLGLYGPRAPEVLASALAEQASQNGTARAHFSDMPLYANTIQTFGGAEVIVIRSDDYGVTGFELLVDVQQGHLVTESLYRSGAVDVSVETMDVCRIEAGRPEFGIDMDEQTIPLEAGIEDRAISLTKGCYVGQEIIVRVLHRGQGRVARRLMGLVGASGDALFARGDRVMDPGGLKDVGVVTSAAFSPRLEKPIGLGYVHRDHAEPGIRVSVVRPGDGHSRKATVVRTPLTPSTPE